MYIYIYIYIAVVILWDSMGFKTIYHLVTYFTTMENPHEDNRQMSRLNGPFSIAKVNYQRVGTYMCFGVSFGTRSAGQKSQLKNHIKKTVAYDDWLSAQLEIHFTVSGT